MAISVQHYFLLLFSLPFFLLSERATCHRHHGGGLRSIHFSVYQHDIINKTGFIITPGVAGAGLAADTAPFGTLFVNEDPLTLTQNLTSKVVGTAEGASLTSSIDGLRSVFFAKMTLNLKRHKGSVSVVGGAYNVVPSDQPIVGGTGDFLFAQGYVTTSFVGSSGLTFLYKLDFHIYWPPYASYRKKYAVES